MRRRIFIAGMLVATAPGRAQAQQPAKVYRIAVAYPIPVAEQRKSPLTKVLFEELRRVGFVEGRNLVVERHSPEGRTENFAELARMWCEATQTLS